MKERVGALDGIRGLALVAVLAYHVGPKAFPGGFLGVEIFFVLSGYLLTSLLLAEHARNGRIDHKRYAARRARRLVPAGLALLVAILLLAPLLAHDDAHRLQGDLLSSVAGATNWHLIADGSSYFRAAGRASFVRHLWSLAVEIQFCLVCSVLAAWLARRSRKVATSTLAGVMTLSAIAMLVLYRTPDPSRAYYGTDTRFGGVLAGVLLAVVVADRPSERLVNLARRLFVPAVVVLIWLVFATDQLSRTLYPGGFLLTQAATSVLIVAGQSGGDYARVLSGGSLRWLGERSYGIYLWHWPLVLLMRPGIDVEWSAFRAGVVTIALAVVLGAISYRFVERPVLRGPQVRELWSKLSLFVPTQGRWTAATAAATLVGALAAVGLHLPTNDPIADSLRAGERLIAAQAVPQSTQTPKAKRLAEAKLASSRLPDAPAPLPPPVLGTFKPGSLTVTALGDSVMVGAAPALAGKFGSSGYIDAQKNRRFSEAPQIARELREQGRLGRVVAVHLGNNGAVKEEEIETLLREVDGAQKLMLVTVRVNRSWQDSVNETLRAAARKHPRAIKLVDWFAYSQGHPDWFYSDGTHLRSNGAEEYAKLVAGSVPPPPNPTPRPTPKPTPTPEQIPLPSLPVPPPRS